MRLYQSFITILILSALLPSCLLTKPLITVTGIAKDEKDGAFVVTDKGYFFIDKLDEWDDSVYEKTVVVTGRLVTVTSKPESRPDFWVQERVGRIQTIKRAKWYIAK